MINIISIKRVSTLHFIHILRATIRISVSEVTFELNRKQNSKGIYFKCCFTLLLIIG